MKIVIIAQIVMSAIGFLLFSFTSGIVGSYVIEEKETPSIIDRIRYSFEHSNDPYIASLFLLWLLVSIALLVRRKRRVV